MEDRKWEPVPDDRANIRTVLCPRNVLHLMGMRAVIQDRSTVADWTQVPAHSTFGWVGDNRLKGSKHWVETVSNHYCGQAQGFVLIFLDPHWARMQR